TAQVEDAAFAGEARSDQRFEELAARLPARALLAIPRPVRVLDVQRKHAQIMGASIPGVLGFEMDIKPLVQFNGSYRLIADLANRTSDEEWRSRAHPNANLIGFTVWHCARIIDWAVNPVMRGEP